MRLKRCIVWAMALLAASCAWGQGEARWLETAHDFGTRLDTTRQLTCQMRMVNAGDSSMVITRVQSTCGCTVASYTRGVVQPGDTATVTLTYTSTKIPGPFEKDVFVYTSGHPRRTRLTVRGKILGTPATLADKYPVAVGPVRLNGANLPFGEIKRPESRSAYLSGYNTAQDTMLVTLADLPAHVSARAVPDTVEPGGVFIVSVNYSTQQAPRWGFNIDTLTLTARPLHPAQEQVTALGRIYVMAQVRENFARLNRNQLRQAPQVEIWTDKVDFGQVQGNAPVQRTFTIKNVGHDPLLIRRLFVPLDEGITVSADRQEVRRGKTATVTVTLHPAERTDRVVNTRLSVMVNDPSTPETLVRLVGVVQ